ncbi:MAG: fimbrillin family protein [Prevotella sp.]
MKKETLFFAALTLVAAGCSETEIVNTSTQDAPESISFSAYANKLTKAVQTDVTTANLTSFNVTAISSDNEQLYFSDVTFTKKGEVWESEDQYVWPNYKLDFYAYKVPENTSETDPTIFTKYIKLDENKNIDITVAKELANQEDFVVAKATEQTMANTSSNANHAVNLTFKHILTQIVVKAKNSNTEDYKVEVSDVAIRNIMSEGNYKFSDETMTAKNGIKEFTASFTAKQLTSEDHEMMTDLGNGKWYLIPQTVSPWVQSTDQTNSAKGAYLALKVKITSTNTEAPIYPIPASEEAETFAWMAMPMPSVVKDELVYNYQQGKKYTIIFNFFSEGTGAGFVDPQYPGDLDGDGDTDDDKGEAIGVNHIKFNATVDDWDSNNTTITINL